MEKHYRWSSQPAGYCMPREQWLMLWCNYTYNKGYGYRSFHDAERIFEERLEKGDFTEFPGNHLYCTEFFFLDRYAYLHDEPVGYLDTHGEYVERQGGYKKQHEDWINAGGTFPLRWRPS